MKDKFGRNIETLRISIVDRCNFSCPYCSREFNKLNKSSILSYEEIIKIVKIFTKFGIKKIKLTGGEPLIKRDICFLIKQLSSMPNIEEVSLTTNGFYLSENISQLIEAGVKRINISLDTLNEKKYKILTGKDCLEKIKQVIKESCKFFNPVKLNIVVMKNINLDEILNFLNFARENKIVLKFVELMPVYKNISFWRENFVSYKIVKSIIEKYLPIYQFEKDKRIKSYKSDEGIIFEFVTSVSEPFCERCDRIRLDCKGDMFLCLYGRSVLNFRKFNEGNLVNFLFSFIYNRDFSCNPFVKVSKFSTVESQSLPIMNYLGG